MGKTREPVIRIKLTSMVILGSLDKTISELYGSPTEYRSNLHSE